MRNDKLYEKIKYCHDAGYLIFVKPVDNYTYKIVISKSTKYQWTDIPVAKRSNFEIVNKIVYSLKIGEIKYRALPKGKDDKWWEKINELYENIYDKLKKNECKK